MALLVLSDWWTPDDDARPCPPGFRPRICGCVRRRSGHLTVWPGNPGQGMSGIYALDDSPEARSWLQSVGLEYTDRYSGSATAAEDGDGSEVAREHAAADFRCGRQWQCACGHCRIARRHGLQAQRG